MTDQREKFREDGFVAVEAFFSKNKLLEIETELDRFIREINPALPSSDIFYELKSDLSSLKQIQRMHEYDGFFARLINGKPRRLAEELLGELVVVKNMQYFNKPPSIGQATPPHQDGYYFMLEPCHALTMWVALDEVDEENGCVRYVRYSHRDGMRPHERTQTLGFSLGIADFGAKSSERDEVACPASPGDLLAHHALTVHRADANSSAVRSRRALGFIFYAESAQEDTAAHQAYKQALERELAEAGKI